MSKRQKKRPPKRTKTKPPATKVKVVDGYRGVESDPGVLPTVQIDIQVPANGKLGGDWLREQCKFLYTASLHKLSLAEIAEHPAFKGHIAIAQLMRWCRDEGWVELRRLNAETWRRNMTAEMGRELIESRRALLKDLRVLGTHIYKELMPNKKGKFRYEVNSYEGLAQVFVKMVGAIDTLTSNTVDEIMPDVQPAQAGATEKTAVAIRPELTLEEARAGAKAVLRMRREAQQRQIEGEAPKGSEES